MRFEMSERITTKTGKNEMMNLMEEKFRKASNKVQRCGDRLVIESIEASFGSINRSDTTTVELKETENGFLAIADVHYRPSIYFWIILILLMFTYVFWLLPIVFYLTQKKTVQNGIKEVFTRASNEFQSSTGTKELNGSSDLDQLEKLASLKEKGTITEEEFQSKKKVLFAT